MNNGYVKSPDAALRFILRHCGVRKSTPHSSGFARLACGLFTKPFQLQGCATYSEIVNHTEYADPGMHRGYPQPSL